MNPNTTSVVDGKRLEWSTPRIVELRYPRRISSTEDRHNWITAMLADNRLNLIDTKISDSPCPAPKLEDWPMRPLNRPAGLGGDGWRHRA